MTQRAFLRTFDAAAMDSFLAAGLADRARYYAPGASAGIDCTAMVDRGVRDYGEDTAPVSTAWSRISLRLDQVQPERGGRLVLLDDRAAEAESFVLDARISTSDESLSRWVAVPHD